jgi:hypothetical protein
MGLLGKFIEHRKRKKLERELENKERTLNTKTSETEKLKEEINMVKLELKDGKIQKVTENKEVPDTLPPLSSMGVPPMPAQADDEEERIAMMQEAQAQAQWEAQQRQLMQQQAMQNAMRQQTMQQQAMQQQAMQQQAMQQQAMQQQAMQQQAMQQQAMMAQQQAMAPKMVTFHVLMTEGRELKMEVDETQIPQLMTDIDSAILDCSALPLGSRTVNGRYILEYMAY